MNENFDVMYKFEQQLQEAEDKFIYKAISPFCETIVEKKIDKKELEKILRRGMQPSIPLDKVKEAREEIEKLRGCSCSCSDGIIDDVEDILDELIESEEK
jgi:hypothetical protein